MEKINLVIEVLKSLGYKNIEHIENKKCIEFQCFGCDAFKKEHKDVIRNILGKNLSEFYYTGNDSQKIYYKSLSK